MSYVIAGRAIKNEYIALGIYGLTGGLVYAYRARSAAKADANKPIAKTVKERIENAKEAVKIVAGSSEEEDFIKNFIAEAERADAGH